MIISKKTNDHSLWRYTSIIAMMVGWLNLFLSWCGLVVEKVVYVQNYSLSSLWTRDGMFMYKIIHYLLFRREMSGGERFHLVIKVNLMVLWE